MEVATAQAVEVGMATAHSDIDTMTLGLQFLAGEEMSKDLPGKLQVTCTFRQSSESI